MHKPLALSLLLAPGLCFAQPDGGPIQQGAAPAKPDTAGTYLMDVWRAVRRKYSDALFLSVSAATDETAAPVCSRQSPFQNGWRYTFYSPRAEAYLMMAECTGSIAGPLEQLRSKDKNDPKDFTISGKFMDSDDVMKTLEAGKIKVDPASHGGMGRRPYTLTLHRLDDERFPSHPTVWKVKVGNDSYLLDAVHSEMFSPGRYGVSLTGGTTTGINPDMFAKRPKKAKVYTVRKDYDRVVEYGKKRFPGADLMAIEGFVDSWGGTPCTGAGDGWAYYFYRPAKESWDVVYACNGKIGPGPTQYIPVNTADFAPLDNPFVDSDKVIEVLLTNEPSCMNETLGSVYTRTGVLLLSEYKKPPLNIAGMWDVKLIWQVTLGRVKFRFDARSGKILDRRE